MSGPRIAAILLAAAAAVAAAGPPDPPVPAASLPFSRRVWVTADGLPEDFAQALAQTPDGYLWIGSSGGLVRFDGVRFTVFDADNEPAIRDDSVYCLLVAHDGALWGGTEGGGLFRVSAGKFRGFGPAEGLTNGFVRVIFEDRSRNLWVGTDDGLFRMEGDHLSRVDQRDGVPHVAVHSIWQDADGRILVGGSGLLVLSGRDCEYYTSPESLADNSIRTIRQTRDGAIWIGTITGLRRLPHGLAGNPFAVPKLIRDANVDFLMESRRRGVLWIGTYGKGLIRYENGRMDRFAAPAWLPHDNVLAIFEDAEDNVWVGTQGGMERLSPSDAETITTLDYAPQSINTVYQDPRGPLYVAVLNGQLFRVAGHGLVPVALPAALAGIPVRNAFRDSRGALWIGTDGQGAFRLNGSAVSRYTMSNGLVNDFIRAFLEDGEGNLWIGTDGGLSRFHDGAFQNFDARNGLAYGSVRALACDGDGSILVATDGGLSRFRAGAFQPDLVLDRLRGEKIWSIFPDGRGGLWIGSHGAGLFLAKNGELAHWTTANGLPTNTIHFIAAASDGRLWMSGPGGVISAASGDLERMADAGTGTLALRVYGAADGLATTQMNGGVQPAGAVSRDGVFWFPSTRGVVSIRPQPAVPQPAPPVLIEGALADDRPVPFERDIQLRPGSGKLEIRYTAIRLRAPELTRFKYWLENFEKDWTDAGQRRVAYYTNVPPGTYRFHVVAYGLNDPTHASERILEVRWEPHFYETGWFAGLIAIAVGGACWGAYRLHVRNIRKRFAAVLEERNRLAREMHDTLIQGCVGVSALLEAASSAQSVSPDIATELLDRARQEVRTTVDEARAAVWDLRRSAGEWSDLGSEVSRLGNRVSMETGIPVSVTVSGTPVAVAEDAGRSMVMLIREALHNAVRHAAPTQLSVAVGFSVQELSIEVYDNGRGFESDTAGGAEGHYGLLGMRERVSRLGGDLELESALGHGTRVRLHVPLKRGAIAVRSRAGAVGEQS
jgi:ligand-binding sensor domain-containing protein/signal transduction histidine kinase